MLPIAIAIVMGALSATVTVLMCKETNKRLGVSQLDDAVQSVEPYTASPRMLAFLAAIVCVSALIGYAVAKKYTIAVAIVEISACYLALLGAAVIDIKTKTIPNFIPLSLVILRVLVLIYELIFEDSALSYFAGSLVGALVCMFFLLIANKLSKGGIGGGDIKLISAVGFLCGLSVAFYTMLFSLIACSIVSACLLAFKKCTAKDQLAFGPFLYLGYLMMCLLTSY